MSVTTLDHHRAEPASRRPHVSNRAVHESVQPHAAAFELQRTAGNGAFTELVDRGVDEQSIARFSFGGLLEGLAPVAGSLVSSGANALGGAIGGDIGGIVGSAGSGLGSAASQFLSGDSSAGLGTLQGVGAAAASPLAQSGFNMLGSAVGGSAGSMIGGLGQSVGSGLSSVIGGGDPAAAGMGVVNSALPGLMQMLSGFLGGR